MKEDQKPSFGDVVQAEMKKSRKSRLISLLFLLAILVAFTFWRAGGQDTLHMQWAEDRLTITDPGGDVYVLPYSDILSVEFVADWDEGVCLSGDSSAFYHYGTWQNDLVGTYQLYASTSCKGCMLLTTASVPVAISYESDSTTSALCEGILDLLTSSGYLAEQ